MKRPHLPWPTNETAGTQPPLSIKILEKIPLYDISLRNKWSPNDGKATGNRHLESILFTLPYRTDKCFVAKFIYLGSSHCCLLPQYNVSLF